jgi:hypothetical protein
MSINSDRKKRVALFQTLCVKGIYVFKHIILITLLLMPIVVWSAYKPVRVIAPQWNGVSCITEQICIESPEKAKDAKALYDSAVGFVNEFVGEVKRNPRVTFCSSADCFGAFGFHTPAKAKTVGLSGIVVGPDGWKRHILRHEIIHHLQSEQLGIIRQCRSPPWFKEGMAYYLSEDTRSLKEPFKSYREKFGNWYRQVGKEQVWDTARKL